VLKVVATIEMPTSHQGAARPDVKNSVVFRLARLAKKMAGRNEMQMLAATIAQSSLVNGMTIRWFQRLRGISRSRAPT
jgi:hypothetical protein